jgi:hypothetical protein
VPPSRSTTSAPSHTGRSIGDLISCLERGMRPKAGGCSRGRRGRGPPERLRPLSAGLALVLARPGRPWGRQTSARPNTPRLEGLAISRRFSAPPDRNLTGGEVTRRKNGRVDAHGAAAPRRRRVPSMRCLPGSTRQCWSPPRAAATSTSKGSAAASGPHNTRSPVLARLGADWAQSTDERFCAKRWRGYPSRGEESAGALGAASRDPLMTEASTGSKVRSWRIPGRRP